MDETTRDKLVENSQASILEGILRGGLAGGIAGGTLFALPTGIYALTNPNPRINGKEQAAKSLADSALLGTVGAAGGAVAGGGAGLVSTLLKRYVANRKLEELEKSAAAKDYLIGGLTGAGVGAGAGMLMNLALGKRALNPWLLLGGAGAGGAIGLGIGHIKAKERDIAEKNVKSREASVERDNDGNILMFDIDGNEVHKENGKWVTKSGVVVEDQEDVGPRPTPGLYIGNHDSIDLLEYAPGGKSLKHMVPMLDNPAGHSDTYFVFSKPRVFTLNQGAKKVKIRTMKGPRGTHILKLGLDVNVIDTGGGPRDDRKGLARMLPYQTSKLSINGVPVYTHHDGTGEDLDGFMDERLGLARFMDAASDDDIKKNPELKDKYARGAMHFLRAWDENAPSNPEKRRQWSHMNLFPVHDPKKGMKEEDLELFARGILGDAYRRKGELGFYNIFPKNNFISQGTKGQGINMCNYLATGVTSLANQEGFVDTNPEITPQATSVWLGGNIKDNKSALDEYDFHLMPELWSVSDPIDEMH